MMDVLFLCENANMWFVYNDHDYAMVQSVQNCRQEALTQTRDIA